MSLGKQKVLSPSALSKTFAVPPALKCYWGVHIVPWVVWHCPGRESCGAGFTTGRRSDGAMHQDQMLPPPACAVACLATPAPPPGA